MSITDKSLLTDLCLHAGFDESSHRLAPYLAGSQRELLEYYPELGYLRDLVILLKYRLLCDEF